MKATVVYLVDCDYPEDYENYHFNIGIFTSLTEAQLAVLYEVKDGDDRIIDTSAETTKNNRQFWQYRTEKGKKFSIMEYALDTKWNQPIEKEYINND